MDMEAYGNFHYGFVGYSIGIPPLVLRFGSVYAHFSGYGTEKGLETFDTIEVPDWEYIDAGIAMAKNFY